MNGKQRLRHSLKCLDGNPIGILWVDADGRMAFVNDTLCRMLGYSRKSLQDRKYKRIDPEKTLLKNAFRKKGSDKPLTATATYRRKDGEPLLVEISVQSPGKDRYAFYYVKVLDKQRRKLERLESELEERSRVYSDLERKNRELTEMIACDFLTKTGSRISFFKEMERALEQARRYQAPLSLLMIDIDFFKQVNDDFGHLLGDDVLVKVSEIVKGSMRCTDFLARWGGEEFVVILTHTDGRGGLNLAERLCRQVEMTDFGIDRKLTISIGVVEYSDQGSVDALIAEADQALYEAKATGRNVAKLSRQ